MGGILGNNGILDRNSTPLADVTGGSYVGEAQQSKIAVEPGLGATDGPEGRAIRVLGTDSLFNPFYIFRYSKFGIGTNAQVEGNYSVDKHKAVYSSSKLSDVLSKSAQISQSHADDIQNPTASKIITWANSQAEKLSAHKGPLYPYPYALNDFLWCKWYGKIPNNRLLTLRRYPIPIEDNLAVSSDKLPLVPIAQAVTWWGGDTGNSLSSILGMTYGFNWNFDATATMEDVQGNEIKPEQLLDAAGIPEGTARTALLMAMGSNPNNPFQSSGYDATIQEFTRQSWEKGAYWNRVKGPVNVINKTAIRTQGYDFKQPIKLEFEYNLRSFGNINPKVAMLDLISNFLSLTYNRATFWGGGYRYYQQTGYILPGFNTDALEKGDYTQALKDILSSSASIFAGKAADLKNWWASVSNDIKGKNVTEMAAEFTDKLGDTRLVNDLLGSRLAKVHQQPLVLRALLDGRAVGEWHLMVGNPMDPLAVIGNLCLKDTSISFSEELGADDFPVSVKFSLTLEPGRPRAKQDIESMFNLGGGDLAFTALQPPSSAMNTMGDYNTIRQQRARGTAPGSEDAVAAANLQASLISSSGATNDAVNPAGGTSTSALNLGEHFQKSVAGRYGAGFGKSPILIDYFTKLETKD
jgi:hypothetical protein